MKDTTRAKFVTLAQKRMNAAIKAIRAVGDLGSRKNALTESEVREIHERLFTEVDNITERLTVRAEGEPDFKLGQNEAGE